VKESIGDNFIYGSCLYFWCPCFVVTGFWLVRYSTPSYVRLVYRTPTSLSSLLFASLSRFKSQKASRRLNVRSGGSLGYRTVGSSVSAADWGGWGWRGGGKYRQEHEVAGRHGFDSDSEATGVWFREALLVAEITASWALNYGLVGKVLHVSGEKSRHLYGLEAYVWHKPQQCCQS
jgi:hypothetical protein